MSKISSMIDALAKRLSLPNSSGTLTFVAVYTFIWGIWTLVFQSFHFAKVYSWLLELGDERFYGTSAIIVGLAMAGTILKDRFPWTTYGAMLGFIFWGLVGVGYLLGDYHSTGAVTAIGLSAYSGYAYLNIRLNQ